MAFGLGKSVPNQGTCTDACTAPSRTGNPKSGGQSTPGLGMDHAKNVNMRPAPQGSTRKGCC